MTSDKEYLLGRIHQLEAQKQNLVTQRERLIAIKNELLEAGQLALVELDLIDVQEFDPDRFRERREALAQLARATRKAEGR